MPMAPQSSNNDQNYRPESRPHSTHLSQLDEPYGIHEHDNSSSSPGSYVRRNTVYRPNNFNRMRYDGSFESTDSSSNSDTSQQSGLNRRVDLPNQRFPMATRYATVNQNIYLFNGNQTRTFHRCQSYDSDEEVQGNSCPAFQNNQVRHSKHCALFT